MPLSDIPVELLLDQVLPAFDLHSLLALASTSKFFASLCSDDTFWKVKLQKDYNFSPNADTARESGWKLIYRRIKKPSVYTWGASSEGRLGIAALPRTAGGSLGVPFPVKVDIKARIVSLVAGGWSFHALDDKGRIHVWGQLSGEGFATSSDGFSECHKQAGTPHRLAVSYPQSNRPVKFRSISCGRGHSAALDAQQCAWVFTTWGHPILLDSEALSTKVDFSNRIIQVESGWDFVCLLTDGGSVYVHWPLSENEFTGELEEREDEIKNRKEAKARAKVEAGENIIPGISIRIKSPPLLLPAIPHDLPDFPIDTLESTVSSDATIDNQGQVAQVSDSYGGIAQGIKLVRVAAGDQFIIGLTNRGHVLSIDISGGGDPQEEGTGFAWLRGQWKQGLRPGWVYMPGYCEVQTVKLNPIFSTGAEFSTESSENVLAPSHLRITHISAHFNSFAAYSVSQASSVVLHGKKRSTNTLEFTQTIYPSLMNQSVISLALGDYHNAAMTDSGKLLTWGKYSSGALGLGDPMQLPVGIPGGYTTQDELRDARSRRRHPEPASVNLPSEVRFDWGLPKSAKKFVLSVTASGWHTGALVLDLDDGDEPARSIAFDPADEDNEPEGMRTAERDAPYPMPTIGGMPSVPGPYQHPPFNPHDSPPGGMHPLPLPPYTTQSPNPPTTHGPAPRHGWNPLGRIGFAGRGMFRRGHPD